MVPTGEEGRAATARDWLLTHVWYSSLNSQPTIQQLLAVEFMPQKRQISDSCTSKVVLSVFKHVSSAMASAAAAFTAFVDYY